MNIIIYYYRSISTAMFEDFKTLDFLNMVPSSDERVVCDQQVTLLSFFIPITFNNQLKACFPNKKYLITIQTLQSIFLIEKRIKNFKDYLCTKSITNNFLFRFDAQ